MSMEPRSAVPQAAPALASEPAPVNTSHILDAAQRALLRSALNRVIPAQGDLPGAGDLEVGSSVERAMAESVRLRRLFLEGFLQIQLVAYRRSSKAFVDLDPASQTAVLRSVEQESPAFFVAMVEHAYRGYYTLPEVHRAIGWQQRPPQPIGYDLPAFDPRVLEQQRARAPFWRRTS